MKAIQTKFHGPTNTKGSRYSASDGDGNRVILSANYALNPDENHKAAALALCAKMHWSQPLIGGGYRNCMYWVFTE